MPTRNEREAPHRAMRTNGRSAQTQISRLDEGAEDEFGDHSAITYEIRAVPQHIDQRLVFPAQLCQR